jgi:RNA polymerase sigma-70 factor (ECF subfamily)
MEQEIRACLDQKRYQEAFDLLLPEFQSKVLRLAYAMLGDAALAEDLAQEVFVRAWKALPGFRGQSSVSTWIYAITRNACLTALKAAAGKKERSLEERGIARAAEQAGKGPSVHATIDIARLLEQLPEKHRQALRLYYLEEKSYAEVSRLLGWPMGTVKTCLHRARKELAVALMQSKMESGKT